MLSQERNQRESVERNLDLHRKRFLLDCFSLPTSKGIEDAPSRPIVTPYVEIICQCLFAEGLNRTATDMAPIPLRQKKHTQVLSDSKGPGTTSLHGSRAPKSRWHDSMMSLHRPKTRTGSMSKRTRSQPRDFFYSVDRRQVVIRLCQFYVPNFSNLE